MDLVEQLREVKDREFHHDSLRTMVLWGADEIERLRRHLNNMIFIYENEPSQGEFYDHRERLRRAKEALTASKREGGV